MQIYTAESQVKNFKMVLRNMLLGLRESRYIAYRLCLRDIKSEYAKSWFGLFWDFVEPLVLAGIFFYLERVGFVRSGVTGMPYVVFVIFGFLLYQTFSEAVTMPLDGMKKAKAILTQLKLTPESMIMAYFFRVSFNASFRIPIMLGTAMIHGTFSPVGALKFLLLFPLIIVAGLAVGICLAPFNTIYNDVGRGTKIGLLVVRFATPVMYSIPTLWLKEYNPVTPLLANLRSLATHNTFEVAPHVLVAWLAVDLIVLLAGWLLFHLSVPILAERA